MQNASFGRRPVGRPPRSSVDSLPARPPPSDAIARGIVDSNETTNHFLGNTAVQRPWMSSTAASSPTTRPAPAQPYQRSIPPPPISDSSLQCRHLPAPPTTYNDRPAQSAVAEKAHQGALSLLPLRAPASTDPSCAPDPQNAGLTDRNYATDVHVQYHFVDLNEYAATLHPGEASLPNPPQTPSQLLSASAHLQRAPSLAHPVTVREMPVAQSRPHAQFRGLTFPNGMPYLTDLNIRFAAMSHHMDLSHNPCQVRLYWLRYACQREDHIFLLLNQLLSMASAQEQFLRELGFGASCDAGFLVLEALLERNERMPKELLDIWTQWPNSPSSLQHELFFKQAIAQIARFLPSFSSRWPKFRQLCINRKRPPLASDTMHALTVPRSKALLSVIFCSLQKEICPHAPPEFGNQVLALFWDDLENALSDKPARSEHTVFQMRYRDVCNQILSSSTMTQVQVDEIRSVLDANILQSSPTQSRATPQSTSLPSAMLPPSTVAHTQRIAASHSNGSPRFHPPVHTMPATRATTSGGTGYAPTHPPGLPRPAIQNVNNAQILRSSPTGSATVSMPTPLTPPAHRNDTIPAANERLLPINTQSLPILLTNPNPAHEALHQAHLQQPTTEIEGLSPSDQQRLFQYIDGYLLEPQTWLPSSQFIIVSFNAPQELVERRSNIVPYMNGPFELSKRLISTRSLVFNLRCVQAKDFNDAADLTSSWPALPTCWPQHIFISINGQHLEIRRKRQHGRDLPIDVTAYVQPDQNEVKISIHPSPNESNIPHCIAIETVGFHSHEQVLTLPTKLDKETSHQTIISAMTPQANDDDIMLVDESMTISITDPFSSRICAVPVRGRSCKHRECFDLETFLESRRSDHKDGLTAVYGWQCPICKGDARPPNLVVDGFFESVCAQLVALGATETRAIIVRSDGSWQAKSEVDGTENPVVAEARRRKSAAGLKGEGSHQSAQPAQATEVIELD